MTHSKHIILGVHITDRLEHAGDVQAVLTAYGCNIKTRLGLHEVDDRSCARTGVLILELVGDERACVELGTKLAAIEGVEVQRMTFAH